MLPRLAARDVEAVPIAFLHQVDGQVGGVVHVVVAAEQLMPELVGQCGRLLASRVRSNGNPGVRIRQAQVNVAEDRVGVFTTVHKQTPALSPIVWAPCERTCRLSSPAPPS